MQIKRVWLLMLALFLALSLTGCKSTSENNASLLSINVEKIGEADVSDNVEITIDSNNMLNQTTSDFESFKLSDYGGIQVSEILNPGIKVNADVLVGDNNELYTYKYECIYLNDDELLNLAESILDDEGVEFEEDERNPGIYYYRYGEGTCQYYYCSVITPHAGATISGETALLLHNAYPNLYPFEDNIISKALKGQYEEINSEQIANNAIENMELDSDYELYDIVPYGTEGRRRYDRLIYKKRSMGELLMHTTIFIS